MAKPLLIESGLLVMKKAKLSLRDIGHVEVRRHQVLVRLLGSAAILAGALYFVQQALVGIGGQGSWIFAAVFGLFGLTLSWLAVTASWIVVAVTNDGKDHRIVQNKTFLEATSAKDYLLLEMAQQRGA